MNKRKYLVVLDKSYLQGCRLNDLEEITKENRILLTAELIYEISSSPDLKKCFKKLLPIRESIDLIEHLGKMFEFEMINDHPCTPFEKHFLKGELNPRFNFKFNKHGKKRIDDMEKYLEKEKPFSFENMVLEMKNLLDYYDPEDFKKKVIILSIYSKLFNPSFPSVKKINENWAIFRKLQIDLLAAKEYLNSFRNEEFSINPKRKAHNQVDFRICIFGLLCKAIASNDSLINRYFKFFCPEGVVYSLL